MRKILSTGVIIHYNKKGNIKFIESPYYGKKENNPLRGGIVKYLSYKLKQLL